MKILFLVFIILITGCSRQITQQSSIYTNYEQDGVHEIESNDSLAEDTLFPLVFNDLMGLWRNGNGAAREISETEIRASGFHWSFTWAINSVTPVRNTDVTTGANYPYGFTVSGKITAFNGGQRLNIGFGFGNGLGEEYAETYFLHISGERLMNISSTPTAVFSRRVSNSEERFNFWGMDRGVVSNTKIIADNVPVRAYPSKSANILFEASKGTWIRILSVSNRIDNIDGYIGNWLEVVGNHPVGGGWVFSRYVERGQVTPSELRIIGLEPRQERRVQQLIASYKVNGIETTVRLWQHKVAHQDFHTFVFDRGITMNTGDGRMLGLFHYRNVLGSYIWFPETNELRHITYRGSTSESEWVIFTDDFRYMIQDFGTSVGPRSLSVIRLEDGERIYEGIYLDDINMRGNTIEVLCICQNEQRTEFERDFRENNPLPEHILDAVRHGMGYRLIILCDLDLDTGSRSTTRALWITMQ